MENLAVRVFPKKFDIYAAGVSDSNLKKKGEYIKELKLFENYLARRNKKKILIYISSTSLLNKNSKKIKNKIDSGIIFLFTEIENKTTISVGVSDDLIAKNLKAGDLVKSIALELQGGGGGREDFAMAGIPHTNADDLKAVVEKIILSILEEI